MIDSDDKITFDEAVAEAETFKLAGRLRCDFYLLFYSFFIKICEFVIMVHGSCVSIGCFAMTDEFIEEIYTLAHCALKNGQSFFRIHIFPIPNDTRENGKLSKFRMEIILGKP